MSDSEIRSLAIFLVENVNYKRNIFAFDARIKEWLKQNEKTFKQKRAEIKQKINQGARLTNHKIGVGKNGRSKKTRYI